MFAVVRFCEDGSVDVVPTHWLERDQCLWPTSPKASRAIKAIKDREVPDSTYKKYCVIVLSMEETYDKARKKLTKAEDTDDIATSTDQVIAVQLSLGKRVILTFRPALVMSTIPAGLAVLRKLEEWPSFSGVHIFRATDVCTPLQCLSSVLQ
ncbi:uncharacterized protein LOC144109452 isoform X2 [Amblyomma americanum]